MFLCLEDSLKPTVLLVLDDETERTLMVPALASEGWDVADAIAEGKAVGMRTEAYEPKVRDYVARRAASGG